MRIEIVKPETKSLVHLIIVRARIERRDPEFKRKLAEVLCVYRAVKLIKETAAAAQQEPSDVVAIIPYDEKPGIQAIATTVRARRP